MKDLEQGAVAAMAKLGERGRTTRIPDDVREAVIAFGLEAREGSTSRAATARLRAIASANP